MKAAAKKPVVCYVTDRKSLAPDSAGGSVGATLKYIRRALDLGVDCVQIREKDLPARQLLELAQAAVQIAGERGRPHPGAARIIVNDRLDVALAAGAHGVHLGQESIAARDVLRWCRAGNAPPEFAIGVSCHSLEEARRADMARADYIFFGPIFETPSKKEFGAPHGIPKLADVCRATPRLEVIAIGGVNAENAVSCVHAGAAGIAAIRMFQDSSEPVALRDTVASIHNWGAEPRVLKNIRRRTKR